MVRFCRSSVVFRFIVAVLVCTFMVAMGFCSMVHAQTVVASTSLAGAIARAAGAKEVRVLTPSETKHPPEYELKPSDLLKLEGANIVIYGGYERMVEKLVETSRNKNMVVTKIDTTTSPENLIAQTKIVAAALHTEKEQQTWEKGFIAKLASLKTRLAPLAGKRAVVHLHTKPFVKWAGLSEVQVVPPGELSLKAVTDAIEKQPEVVIDILHMPAAKVIADNAHCRYVLVINFPAAQGTVTLEDIFEFNTAQILKAFQEKKL
jgi:zinc transport system substrate-binding protein